MEEKICDKDRRRRTERREEGEETNNEKMRWKDTNMKPGRGGG